MSAADDELVDPNREGPESTRRVPRIALTRRQVIVAAGSIAVVGGVAANFKRLGTAESYAPLLRFGDRMGRVMQRSIMPDRPLAPVFTRDQLTQNFPQNGGFGASYIQKDPDYERQWLNGFRDWRLSVDGLVARPGRFSLEDLRAMPQRTQITMHSCDMGWSAIGEWTGVPLRWLLEHVGIRNTGRYVVFHCMDKFMGAGNLYSSIDRLDAFHPQTLLAHRMNGATLPKKHGAPVRLRMELQIGYKQSKHIQRIEVVESLKGIGRGFGGLYEDMGYQWYAGM